MQIELRHKIDFLIKNHGVILFLKGTKDRPQCGFSKQVVEVLKGLAIDFLDVDVLSDPELREGIKIYSSWPTIPQLYINGEFIGGCDIVLDLYAKGELQKLLHLKKADKKPEIILSEKAQASFKNAACDMEEGEAIRVAIGQNFEHALSFSKPSKEDFIYTFDGFAIAIDPYSALLADGLRIDYVEDNLDAGFSFYNPHEPQDVLELEVKQLKSWLDQGQDVVVIDVRPKAEHELAKLAFAKPLFAMNEQEQKRYKKDQIIVFHCHHGSRSKRVAEQWRAQGFSRLYNLTGGIDAWSRHIDNNVPVYTK